MKILLTGAAGFIGSNICNKLNDGTNQITVIDNLKTGYLSNLPNNITFIHSDCSDETLLERNETYDCIIHVAQISSQIGNLVLIYADSTHFKVYCCISRM